MENCKIVLVRPERPIYPAGHSRTRTDNGRCGAGSPELMADEHENEQSGEVPAPDSPAPDARPFDQLPDVVSDGVAAYAMVARQLPRDPGAPPRASLEALGRLDTPFRPVEDVRALFGAGTYRLTFFTEQHHYVKRAWVTVGEGVARLQAQPDSPGKPAENPYGHPSQAPVSGSYDAPPWALDLLRRQDQLEARVNTQPAPAGLSFNDLKTLVELTRTLQPPPADAAIIARSFRQGLEVAREAMRGGRDEGGGLAAAIGQALPAVLAFVQQQQGGGAPAVPGAAPTAAGGAQNVTPAWVIPLVQEFNRALNATDDPGYTASWIERNVPDAVQAQLRGPEDAVVGELKKYVKAIPGLGTPDGEKFVRAVLAELRGEGEADEAAGDEVAGAGGQE